MHILKIVSTILVLCTVAHANAQTPLTTLKATVVPLSDELNPGDAIGKIRPRGMLALPNINVSGLRFAQLSALAWDDDDEVLYALSDKGNIFHLKPIFRDGLLVEVKALRAFPLREKDSGQPLKWRRVDAEGMDILNGRNGIAGDAELIVSFERYPRIVSYRPDGRAIQNYPLPAPLTDVSAYQDENKGLEGVCSDTTLGVLTMPEAPLRRETKGFNRIFTLSGKSWLYLLEGDNRVVALECLSNGEVLVLERDYGRVLWRAAVALKKATLNPAHDTASVETIVSLDNAGGYHIDNFEGLTRHRGNRFFMISDDNDLFIQRTLLLYFEVIEDKN